MLNKQLFIQPKYLSPILILSSALFVPDFHHRHGCNSGVDPKRKFVSIYKAGSLERLQGDILHLIEATMSARMAASGDLQREDRYRKYEPWMGRSSKLSIYCPVRALGDGRKHRKPIGRDGVGSFEAVLAGRSAKSLLLFSPVYEEAKTNYDLVATATSVT